MKKISIALIFTISINLFSEVEILNRVAVIVDEPFVAAKVIPLVVVALIGVTSL